ncbi:MAG: hypothetical protein ACI82O_003342 [Patiriisocius sp.]|jgi:hypothetical protein
MWNLLPRTVIYRGLVLFFSILLLAACDSDIRTVEAPGNESADATDSGKSPAVHIDGVGTVTLVEGEGSVVIPLSVTRAAGRPGTGSISLTARRATSTDELELSWEFEQNFLQPTESATNLTVQMSIGPRPIQPQIRTLLLSASDGVSPTGSTQLNISIEPTDKPDVYLIVGQSNAVGFSEDNSKRPLIGQPDAPNGRILQLNVTGNDGSNFSSPADFTLAPNLYSISEPLTPAVDPLHTGYNSESMGKSGQRISFGLSFAKQALQDTTTDIYLVPAAWSDTGFCSRSTNPFRGAGWNATEKNNPALSGTLLHDRAIARANITLSLTGGILRGILWHQGEADSDSISCANVYEDNLVEVANSLRANIAADARGASARNADSDIPFIVGTMSKGADPRDSQLPFSAAKAIVDAAHRNVATTIPIAGFVNNDDFVPPAYPCGEGTCVHFGAQALREMGFRYYDKLTTLLPQN